MNERIGIIGIGELPHRWERSESLEEFVHEASRETLSNAGVEREDIDNTVLCASDLEDGRAISSMVAACPGGSYRKDMIKTTDTGIHALGLAAMRMEAGVFDTTLVMSWAKQSETNEPEIRKLEADPPYRRGTGLGHQTGHAVHATAYQAGQPAAMDAANHVVERNTTSAAESDRGLPESATSQSAAAESPVVSWPLREEHLPKPSDGAVGMVLVTESACEKLGADPVWLDGVGWETAGYDGSTFELGELEAATGAADSAYEEAGVTDPTTFDAAEIHSKNAFHELMVADALGLPGNDDAASAELDGAFDAGGSVPVNPSGGPYAGNPLIATGLQRVAAAVRHIEDGADRTVAHATAGFTDQVHGVAVLNGRNA